MKEREVFHSGPCFLGGCTSVLCWYASYDGGSPKDFCCFIFGRKCINISWILGICFHIVILKGC